MSSYDSSNTFALLEPLTTKKSRNTDLQIFATAECDDWYVGTSQRVL